MKGFRMMLEALGVRIDPEEIERTFVRLQTEMPQLADAIRRKFESIDARLANIESLLLLLCENARIGGTRAVSSELVVVQRVNGKSEETECLMSK